MLRRIGCLCVSLAEPFRLVHSPLLFACADKESSNCRLEAQYAHQTGVDMIPMMMENPEKKVRGWLGKAHDSRP